MDEVISETCQRHAGKETPNQVFSLTKHTCRDNSEDSFAVYIINMYHES